MGKQNLNDSVITQSGRTLFQFKFYQPNNFQRNHNRIVRKPGDCRANENIIQDSNTFKRLDIVYVSDVVGDMIGVIINPFESAKNSLGRKLCL